MKSYNFDVKFCDNDKLVIVNVNESLDRNYLVNGNTYRVDYDGGIVVAPYVGCVKSVSSSTITQISIDSTNITLYVPESIIESSTNIYFRVTWCDNSYTDAEIIPRVMGDYKLITVYNNEYCDNLKNKLLCGDDCNYCASEYPSFTGDCCIKQNEVQGDFLSESGFYMLTKAYIGDCVDVIYSEAFRGHTALTNLILGSGVTTIGQSAFAYCRSLFYVDLTPVEEIFETAFNVSGIFFIDFGCKLKKIGNGAFCERWNDDCNVLNLRGDLLIPHSVTSIGSYAFEGCSLLKSIHIGSSVETIGYKAFAESVYSDTSSLPIIYIHSMIPPTIDGMVFGTNSGRQIYVPYSVVNTYKRAFSPYNAHIEGFGYGMNKMKLTYSNSTEYTTSYESSLTVSYSDVKNNGNSYINIVNAEIGEYVNDIDDYTFSGCSSLTSITVNALIPPTLGNNVFDNTNNCPIYVPTQTIHLYKKYCKWVDYVDRIQTIGGYYGTKAHLVFVRNQNVENHCVSAEYDIPCDSSSTLTSDEIRMFTKTTNGNASLNEALISECIIGDCVTEIGDNAFDNGGFFSQYRHCLNRVFIPNSVTRIGDSAFSSCEALTSITIPDSVTSIGNDAFNNCYRMQSAIIGNGVTSIGSSTFTGCWSLSSVTIGSGVTSIGDNAFEGCSSLSSITIPNGVTSIGSSTFDDCFSLTSITIPNSVTSIGNSAFCYCSSASSVTIGSGVTNIGNLAFAHCYNLTSITCNATTPPTLGNSAFDDTNYCLIFVPNGTATAYRSANGWSSYASRIFEEESGDLFKAEIAFRNLDEYTIVCDGNGTLYQQEVQDLPLEVTEIKSVYLGNCTFSIANNTFKNCTSLTNVFMANSVTNIGVQSFFSATSLTSITLSDRVTNISAQAFENCTSLTSIDIPNSVTTIGYNAFRYCSSLTSVTLGSGLTSIGTYPFSGCSSLPIVNNIRYADTYAVEATDKTLSMYSIKQGTKWIGDAAFKGCSNLLGVTIPNSVIGIQSYAFENCSSLTSITIGSGVAQIKARAFNSCSGLTSITCNATTPPTLDYGVFENTNDCPIYVPADSVNAYKAASGGWSDYASRIQAIPT